MTWIFFSRFKFAESTLDLINVFRSNYGQFFGCVLVVNWSGRRTDMNWLCRANRWQCTTLRPNQLEITVSPLWMLMHTFCQNWWESENENKHQQNIWIGNNSKRQLPFSVLALSAQNSSHFDVPIPLGVVRSLNTLMSTFQTCVRFTLRKISDFFYPKCRMWTVSLERKSPDYHFIGFLWTFSFYKEKSAREK